MLSIPTAAVAVIQLVVVILSILHPPCERYTPPIAGKVYKLAWLSLGDNIKLLARDPSLDTLLLLDAETFVVDAEGLCWVKFVVKQVVVSPERPHGLDYSLTLHDQHGERLLGFDNAHPIRETSGPGARTRIEFDHKHRGERVRFYTYADAATLLADFWTEVESILQQRN